MRNDKSGMFSAEITQSCALCEHANHLQDVKFVLCSKKGVGSAEFCCKKFSYDPLKRQPKRIRVLAEYSPDDFSIQ